MKKKRIALLFAAIFAAIALCSCGPEDIDLGMGKTQVLENYIEFTPVNAIMCSDEIYAPVGSESGWVYNGDMEDPAYVALVASVKNLTDKEIKMQNFAVPILKQGGQEYESYQNLLLVNNDTLLSSREAIGPKEEGTVYILMDGQQKTRGNAEVELTFDNDDYEKYDIYHLKLDTSKNIDQTLPLKKDKAVTADGYGEITLKKVDTGKRVEPTKASKYDGYTYFTPKKPDTVLLDIQIEAENLQKEKCPDVNFVGARAVKGEKTCYGYVVTETKDNKNLKDLVDLKPGEKRLVHAIIEVPSEWKSGGVQLYLYFNGQFYEYSWK